MIEKGTKKMSKITSLLLKTLVAVFVFLGAVWTLGNSASAEEYQEYSTQQPTSVTSGETFTSTETTSLSTETSAAPAATVSDAASEVSGGTQSDALSPISSESPPPSNADTDVGSDTVPISSNDTSGNQNAFAPSSGASANSTFSNNNTDSNRNMSDPTTDKASYKAGENVAYQVTIANNSQQAQNMTVGLNLRQADRDIGNLSTSHYLEAGEKYTLSNTELVVPSSWLSNNTGYIVTLTLKDGSDTALATKRVGLSVEDNWTVFPRYGVIAGSPTSENSVLSSNMDDYNAELALLKAMNINSYFFYDVYNTPTDPFPDVENFKQDWNTWSNTYVDTAAVKELVNSVHDSGAVAMLYNMISADSNVNNPLLSADAMAYNYYDNFGKSGQVMTYSINDKPLQIYYDPSNKSWQNYIAQAMREAMKRGGFDGWQGDTIGDNDVTSYDKIGSGEHKRMSDTYSDFINAMKELLGNDYYVTINDVNGENTFKMTQAKQDIVYNELWTNGSSLLDNTRKQTTYGDLKARVDEAYRLTGKSLVVAAYMEEPGIDYTVAGGAATNASGQDALDGKNLQAEAALLVDAVVAASGGYHMSMAALANSKTNANVLQSAYYPTQYLSVSDDDIQRFYNYQQFITGYENLLRGSDVRNSSNSVSTYGANGLLSKDSQGVSGDQVWTFAKSGQNFSTIHLINLMGISSDWKNEAGSYDSKKPSVQKDLTVRYSLTGRSQEEAEKIAKQVYLTSPDEWSKSEMTKLKASVSMEGDTPVLSISVPTLALWDMIYIRENDLPDDKVAETVQVPASPVVEEPAPTTETPTSPVVEDPEPTAETPTTPAVEDPAPTAETPTSPVAEDPTPTDEVPTAPVDEEPAPTAETPTSPVAEDPAPTDEAPTTPVVEDPAPTDEAPTSPVVEEPAPTEEVPSTPSVEDPIPSAEDSTPMAPIGSDIPTGETPVVPRESQNQDNILIIENNDNNLGETTNEENQESRVQPQKDISKDTSVEEETQKSVTKNKDNSEEEKDKDAGGFAAISALIPVIIAAIINSLRNMFQAVVNRPS
ncbi:glycoside hydrolase family 66 protein [Streptococcus dentiloxodontae]